MQEPGPASSIRVHKRVHTQEARGGKSDICVARALLACWPWCVGKNFGIPGARARCAAAPLRRRRSSADLGPTPRRQKGIRWEMVKAMCRCNAAIAQVSSGRRTRCCHAVPLQPYDSH